MKAKLSKIRLVCLFSIIYPISWGYDCPAPLLPKIQRLVFIDFLFRISGASKGYAFITFDSQTVAEKVI